MKRRMSSYLVGLMLWGVLSAFHDAQSATPPPPTATPTLKEICLNNGLANCIDAFINAGDWIGLVLLIIGLVVFGFLLYSYRGVLDAFKETVKDRVKKHLTAGDTPDVDETARSYLVYVSKAYQRFKFRGLPRTRAEGIEPLELDKVYISIQVEPMSERKKSAGKGSKREDSGLLAGGEMVEKTQPVGLDEAIKLSKKLAIIGIAGSGKSTLLQWAGLCCARSCLGIPLNNEQEMFMASLGSKKKILPLLIPLRAFNDYCKVQEKQRSSKSMLDFLQYHFSQKHSCGDFSSEFFKKHLEQGCLLMFDGLDEVDPDDRVYVRAAVEEFLIEYDSQNLFCLIASRYSAVHISDQMAGFLKCEVQRLTSAQRNDLIHFWYKAVYLGDIEEANRKAEDLMQRIKHADERVQKLATTPLMVTIFAMVHNSRDELPRQRAKLYEEAVEVLLTEVIYHDGEHAAGLQKWAGMDWETRRNRLAQIAFTLHTLKVPSFLENDLVDMIWGRFGSEEQVARQKAKDFLCTTAERGGLLEELDGRYGFYTHATFQEFLAGRYLAEEYPLDKLGAYIYDHLEDDTWEEPIRLAAGYLSIKGEGKANQFVQIISDLGDTDEKRALALALAGFSLGDIPKDSRFPDTVGKIQGSIQNILETNPPQLSPKFRFQIGLALGAIGDPRIDALHPKMAFIQGSVCQLGTSREDEQLLTEQEARVWDDEKPDYTTRLSSYEIGIFPVTNAEYRLFWEAHGYQQQELWGWEGWLWQNGEWESDLSSYDEDLRNKVQQWIRGRTINQRKQPFFWDDPKWNGDNLPVVGVCWFEAEAYCNWLSAKTGLSYRLPREAEWENAARGARRFLWPWGNQWDAEKCNCDESKDKFGKTSPVGIYPDGQRPDSALDMVGNVWEWCQDWYDEEEYARRALKEEQDPVGPETAKWKVLRGGSWFNNRYNARCASRLRNEPDDFYDLIGFRLVRSPIRSES